ncbi:MAG: aldo/keto reductase [Suipraeoptans sp.]
MKKIVTLKDNTTLSNLGQGTWMLGEDPKKRTSEIESIRIGIDNGLTLIDTAEMYGNGSSEKLIGEAITGYNRNDLFLVSKVYPHNAGRDNIFNSCRDSIKRLGSDYLDLYLLHWRGHIPLKETINCMEELIAEGIIKRWGVSNFDIDDMEELLSLPNGEHCMVNQVLYHLGSRGIDYSLYPFLKENDIATMAYCPMAQAGSLKHNISHNLVLNEIADAHNISVIELLLCFVLTKDEMIAIPRTGNPKHALMNANAVNIVLTTDELDRIDKEFPKPTKKEYLDIV